MKEETAAKADKLKIDWYTPTPGGTGPILVAKLFENFYKLNGK
jgi:5,10-methylene-tetrahydrofolate dehydrogenase/methenyl tetrahydrofolate cyclohydrolase